MGGPRNRGSRAILFVRKRIGIARPREKGRIGFTWRKGEDAEETKELLSSHSFLAVSLLFLCGDAVLLNGYEQASRSTVLPLEYAMSNRFVYLKNVTTLKFDSGKCTGCGTCLEVCPQEVFQRADGTVRVVNRDSCMECGRAQRTAGSSRDCM